ncbi:MAG: spore coat protein CotJB [Oscillospiraceae bacterium]|nr:spore coat protein CotJB [Oscillospiraceae bacterium]
MQSGANMNAGANMQSGGNVQSGANAKASRPTQTCDKDSGTMPSCAPLAVPYVPFQQKGASKYDHTEALNNGTLFPALNLPFRVKSQAANVVDCALSELQALEFVLAELSLYLDTHPDDEEAFSLFQQYADMEREGRQRYEAAFGPLTKGSAGNFSTYRWLEDPWPWNYPEGGKK